MYDGVASGSGEDLVLGPAVSARQRVHLPKRRRAQASTSAKERGDGEGPRRRVRRRDITTREPNRRAPAVGRRDASVTSVRVRGRRRGTSPRLPRTVTHRGKRARARDSSVRLGGCGEVLGVRRPPRHGEVADAAARAQPRRSAAGIAADLQDVDLQLETAPQAGQPTTPSATRPKVGVPAGRGIRRRTLQRARSTSEASAIAPRPSRSGRARAWRAQGRPVRTPAAAREDRGGNGVASRLR